MKISGIYKIQSLKYPDKIYIGSAIDLRKRKNTHFAYLNRGDHHSIKLQNHYNKYGKEDLIFIIMEPCFPEFLIIREQYYIDTLEPFFNICKIAGSFAGKKHSQETKDKLRNLNLGKHLSEETKRKIGLKSKGNKYNIGRIVSEGTREKLSMAIRGRKMPPRSKETIQKMRLSHLGQKAWNKGIPLTDDVKKILSIKAKGHKRNVGHKLTEETKRKISESHKGKSRKPHTQETLLKMSTIRKAAWESGKYNNIYSN